VVADLVSDFFCSKSGLSVGLRHFFVQSVVADQVGAVEFGRYLFRISKVYI